jgi:hypothetical protein
MSVLRLEYMGLVIFFIIVLAIYIYILQFYHIEVPKYFIDEIQFRTGDVILFKAQNNFNAPKIASYFTHIGVVYVRGDQVYLFEANGIEGMNLKKHHNKNGVFLSKLYGRASKYKGRCFLKPLIGPPIDDEVLIEFEKFMKYALSNMYYDTRVIRSSVGKWINGIECGHDNGTNCGELAYLSLVNLGIIEKGLTLHYLKYISELGKCEGEYKYGSLIELIDHPFDM